MVYCNGFLGKSFFIFRGSFYARTENSNTENAIFKTKHSHGFLDSQLVLECWSNKDYCCSTTYQHASNIAGHLNTVKDYITDKLQINHPIINKGLLSNFDSAEE